LGRIAKKELTMRQGKMKWGILVVIGCLVIFDLVFGTRQATEDPVADAYFWETGNEEVDAVTTASPTAQVSIIRSDYSGLARPVPTTEALTSPEIQDMVYTAIETDRDSATGLPGLYRIIRDKIDEQGACWVVVKANIVFEPGQTYMKGDQTDPRVMRAVLSYLAERTDATRITLLAGGSYTEHYGEDDIFTRNVFLNNGRWNDFYPDLPSDFTLESMLVALATNHPEKVLDTINLNYNEIMEDGRAYNEIPQGDRAGLKPLFIPVPEYNGIGGVNTANLRMDGAYNPTDAILHSDVLVNVPVMKTTGHTAANCVMKNYVGSVSRGVYASGRGRALNDLDHGELVHTVVNLFSYHPSDYVVVDAIAGLEGEGSHPQFNGKTGFVRRNFVLAGRDPVAVEAVAAASMGFNPNDMETLRWSRAKKLGYFELAKIVIEGNTLDDVRMDFMHPVDYTPYTAGYFYGRGCTRWLINGLHEGSDLTVGHLGEDEAGVDPEAGDIAGGKTWTVHYSPFSYVDLAKKYDSDASDCVIYAFTRIHSEEAQEGELWVGATKGIEVFLNGARVISESATGGHSWKGIVQPISLRRGDNSILIKANNGTGRQFGFSLAAVDNGLNTERETYIPHKNRRSLGSPTAFTENMKRRYFGGDTLPGTCYHLAKSVASTAVNAGGEHARPARFVLEQNYPNPFNAATAIRFQLLRSGPVELSIYALSGQRIRRLVRGHLEAGEHTLLWNGSDDAGHPTASGVYFYRLIAGTSVQSRSMALIR
jgi:hypothetical protein